MTVPMTKEGEIPGVHSNTSEDHCWVGKSILCATKAFFIKGALKNHEILSRECHLGEDTKSPELQH